MTPKTILAALCAIIAVDGVAAERAAAAPVDSLLSNVRVAMGASAVDRSISIYKTGNVDFGGIKGRFEQWSDDASNALAGYLVAGPFTGGSGFDGSAAWSQDASGFVWADGGKAGIYNAIAETYLANNDLLRPQKRGTVTLIGPRTEGGGTFDVIEATPPNGLPLQIWLDAKTHLAVRTSITVGVRTTTTLMSDYRSVSGLMVPYHEHSTSDTGNNFDVTLTSAQVNPPNVASHLMKPASHVTDTSMTTGVATTVPIELVDNHVYLSVMLNGKGPYTFVFDTGGANVVDSGVAKEIGATTAGMLQGSGVGNQSEGFSFTKLTSVGIGDAKIADQYFAVVPIRQSFGMAGGRPADGLIGFEVLARFITTFDYGHKTLTLRLPGGGAQPITLPSGADVIPFVFNDTIPQVACALDGIATDCTVDTGSRVSLSLTSPFIAAHPNVVPANATAPGINGFGVGGPAMGRLGRLTSLQIGKTNLSGLIADFSVQQQGFFANPFVAANVGGGVWKRFSVTFDYAAQTMALVPNADFAKREQYERSGLFLITQGGALIVLAARPGTPAAQAGLGRGDTITAINGKPASDTGLQQVREMLMGPAGTKIDLSVKTKAGLTRDVVLTLRDYV